MHAKRILSFPFFPGMLACLPVVQFYRNNFQSLYLSDLVEPVLLYGLAAVLLLGVARWAWKSWDKAGVIAGGLCSLLFGSGDSSGWAALSFAILWLGLAIGLIWVRRPFPNLTLSLNVFAATLVALPLFACSRMNRQLDSPSVVDGYDTPIRFPESMYSGAGELPDIYFIVADGLGRPDVLERMYGLPRSVLTHRLEEMGFLIAEGSLTSYPQTALSLAATLNMAPVDQLLEIPDPESGDRRPLGHLVARNRVTSSFKELGYRMVSYPSGYTFTRIAAADVTKKPRLALGFLTMHALNKSILPRLQRALGQGPADLRFAIHRHRLTYILSELKMRVRACQKERRSSSLRISSLHTHPSSSTGTANRWDRASPSRSRMGTIGELCTKETESTTRKAIGSRRSS